MAKLEDGRGELPKLPSVGMALLPHEVRAARARNAMIAGSAVALLAGAGIVMALPHVLDWSKRGAPTKSKNGWPSERADGDLAASVLVAGDGGMAEPTSVQLAASAEPKVNPLAADQDDPSDPRPELAAPPEGEGVDPTADEAPAAVPNDPGEVETRVVRPFGQARGFRDALIKGGASGADADAITDALGKLVNFRRCRPEDELTFERDASGQLVGFEYRPSVTERYRADRAVGGRFVGKRVEVAIEYRRIARGGYVSDSLGRAVEALGLGTNLASAFVEAFEGKVDFKKDTRSGDSFRLIVDEQIVEGKSFGYGPVLAVEYKGERCGQLAAYWFSPSGQAGDFYDESGRALHGGWLRTPLRYDHISSGFNPKRRHPILKRIIPHNGVDYAAAPGTTVWSAADGEITFAGARGANGNLVSIKHPGGYETHYAHLLRITRGIKAGVSVKQRQPIGAVGSTGRSTGPHLHFALKRGGAFLDPIKQLNGPGKQITAQHLPALKQHIARLKRDLAQTALAPAPAPAGSEASAPEEFHDESLDL